LAGQRADLQHEEGGGSAPPRTVNDISVGVKRLTYDGIASFALGLLCLFLLTAPFMMVYGSFTSAYDLAFGQYHLSGGVYSLSMSYPAVWICVLGGLFAIVFGLDAMFPFTGNQRRNFWKIIDSIGLSGIMVLVGASILFLQLTLGPMPLVQVGGGSYYPMGPVFPIWGVGVEFPVGLGLITAAWSK
jgi:hypothetical protein